MTAGTYTFHKSHIFIALPLSFLLLAILWFLFFRFDWTTGATVPKDYDFFTDIGHLDFEGMHADMQSVALENAVTLSCESTDVRAIENIFWENSIADLNIYEKIASMEKCEDFVNYARKQKHFIFPYLNKSLNIYYHMGYEYKLKDLLPHVYSLLDILLYYYLKTGDLNEAKNIQQRIHLLLLKDAKGSMSPPDAEFVKYLNVLAVSLHHQESTEELLNDAITFVDDYGRSRITYRGILQCKRLEAIYFIEEEAVNTRFNFWESVLSGFYRNEKVALKNIDKIWYACLEARGDAEREDIIDRARGILYSRYHLYFFQDLLGLSAFYQEVDRTVADQRMYENEPQKIFFLAESLKAYAKVLRYKNSHQHMPDTLEQAAYVPMKEIPVFYQKVSDSEWYISSVGHLDVNDGAERERLLTEHAYWYYREE